MNSAVLSAAALTFLSERHEYWLAGIKRPSVTEILRATGVSTDFESLGATSDLLRGQIEFKRDLGTALHADIHSFDDGALNWATVDDRVLPYLEAWMVYRENSGLKPLARERLVFHPALNYAGTLDGIFERPDGTKVLLDVKTGDPEDAAAHLQTAGYQLAYACEHPDIYIGERCSVQLLPEHRTPYRVTPYRDFDDFATWQAIVTTYWNQASRRRRHE